MEHDANGRNVVRVVSNRAVIARSYIVDCLYVDAAGNELTYTVTHVSFGGPPFSVPPSGQQTLACPPTTKEADVRAVVYEDGTSEGRQPYLGNLIFARQAELPEILAALNILQGAATASAPADGNTLAEQIFNLVPASSSSTTTGSADHPCLWIARVIRSNHQQPLGAYLSRMIRLLTTYSAVVQSSMGR
jgi:hypothetical protein